MPTSFAQIAPILMLAASNIFMTFAWYGHLKFGSKPLWLVVIVSWGIAFFEYCLAVPHVTVQRHHVIIAKVKRARDGGALVQ